MGQPSSRSQEKAYTREVGVVLGEVPLKETDPVFQSGIFKVFHREGGLFFCHEKEGKNYVIFFVSDVDVQDVLRETRQGYTAWLRNASSIERTPFALYLETMVSLCNEFSRSFSNFKHGKSTDKVSMFNDPNDGTCTVIETPNWKIDQKTGKGISHKLLLRFKSSGGNQGVMVAATTKEHGEKETHVTGIFILCPDEVDFRKCSKSKERTLEVISEIVELAKTDSSRFLKALNITPGSAYKIRYVVWNEGEVRADPAAQQRLSLLFDPSAVLGKKLTEPVVE